MNSFHAGTKEWEGLKCVRESWSCMQLHCTSKKRNRLVGLEMHFQYTQQRIIYILVWDGIYSSLLKGQSNEVVQMIEKEL